MKCNQACAGHSERLFRSPCGTSFEPFFAGFEVVGYDAHTIKCMNWIDSEYVMGVIIIFRDYKSGSKNAHFVPLGLDRVIQKDLLIYALNYPFF